ncbi:MAG TPA: hypothetical protein ENJ87_12935 [Gammaproteobacteria bacterium]|nr:hypothetical protein [Gammaproteobacteria bacterium]
MDHSLNRQPVIAADSTPIEKTGMSKKQLIIGLDFGAAFTKVIIGDNRVRYAVPFDEAIDSDNRYLLPSILEVNENNACALSSGDESSSTTSNLKLPLLDKTYTDEDLLRITAYLALVFRASRDWLLTRYQKRYGRTALSWSINAGLPIDDTEHTELADLYKRLLHTAWVISVLPGPVTLNRVRQYISVDENAFDAFPAVYRSRIIDKDRIATFSGIIAQICGYTHLNKGSGDLHMLIDIGAATFSIATFNIGAGEDDCALYTCAAEPIGVCYLLKRRYENLQLPDDDINLFRHIPDTHAFSQAHDLTDKEIKFADTLYSGDAGRQINKILDVTKTQHRPDSSLWESGLPTFICGGGAHLEIIENIRHSFENKSPPHKIHSVDLKVPDDLMLENLPDKSFDRLSVAYGLSFRSDEMTRYLDENVMSDAEDISELQGIPD